MSSTTGDPNALTEEEFLRLFLAHQRRLYAYILMLLPRHADADDVFQQTCITLWKRRGSFERGTNFNAWASRVAFNTVLNFRAKLARERVRFDEDLLARIAARAEEMGNELDERRTALSRCLEKLPANDRNLLERRYEPGVTIKSLAAAVGRPVEGMYKAMRRIHAALSGCIDRAPRGGHGELPA
jgi:RNA polymerase sigma-70 factor (ECF subfamily)